MERAGRRGSDGAEEVVLALVRGHAGELLRFARRFSLCADDAQDAYQRALEILVVRLRTTRIDNPLSYLRTVVRHEAFHVRIERERLLTRDEVDVDEHGAARDEDPAEHAERFERLTQTAEALSRLKPQELKALTLRAEGLSYREICSRMDWSYTRTNRCLAEGRRSLLERLRAIESGAECERWLPLLSTFADGEANAREVAELRPHLRSCSACRATLRAFHTAPRQLSAIVPPQLAVPATAVAAGVGDGIARHAEAAVQGVLERIAAVTMRLHGAVEALSGAKVAAVAASTVVVAGGGVAIEQATRRPASEQRGATAAQVASAGARTDPSLATSPIVFPAGTAVSRTPAAGALTALGTPVAEWASAERTATRSAPTGGEFLFEGPVPDPRGDPQPAQEPAPASDEPVGRRTARTTAGSSTRQTKPSPPTPPTAQAAKPPPSGTKQPGPSAEFDDGSEF